METLHHYCNKSISKLADLNTAILKTLVFRYYFKNIWISKTTERIFRIATFIAKNR